MNRVMTEDKSSVNAQLLNPDKSENTELTIKKRSRYFFAYVGLVVTPLFWAGNFLLSRMASYDLSPMTLSFWRWLFAFLIILPFSYKHLAAEKDKIMAQLKPLLILAALGIAAYNSLVYVAAHSTTAINMTLFAAALPVTTILFAWLILAAKPTPLQNIGVIFSVIGFLTIMTSGSLSALLHIELNAGDLLMLCATICWALYSVLFKKWGINLKPMVLLTVLFGLGTIMITPFYLASLWVHGGLSFESHITLTLLYLAIFPSILAFLFWNKGLQVLGPNITAVFMYLVPIFTAILSIPLLGESLQRYHFIGGGAIVIGVYIATLLNDRHVKLSNDDNHKNPSLNDRIDTTVQNSFAYIKSPEAKTRLKSAAQSQKTTITHAFNLGKKITRKVLSLLIHGLQKSLKLTIRVLDSAEKNLTSANDKPKS